MRERSRTDYIAIHCSATPPDRDIGEREITEMHIARGWRTIGYNELIRRDGRIEIGRGLDFQGAHVKGYNDRALGICLIGGVDANGKAENNFTDQQFYSLDIAIRHALKLYPGAIVQGHRDFSPDLDGDGIVEPHEWLKECPCFSVADFLDQMNARDPL